MHLDKTTLQNVGLMIVLLFGVFVWVTAIVLLLEVTRQLLDVLMYVVELAQMS